MQNRVVTAVAVAVVMLAGAILSACQKERVEPHTLYRNSTLDYSMRVRWATFDADEGPNYNLNNCQMAARLLNANVTASAKVEGKPRDQSVGFWCERGSYIEEGPVPTSFPEAFPTDG
jgi:hypothetical protein